jgi:hypothetical protein
VTIAGFEAAEISAAGRQTGGSLRYYYFRPTRDFGQIAFRMIVNAWNLSL